MNATRGRAERSAEANARLTGATGLVLLVLSCAEAATVVLGVRSVLTLHVVIGLLLVPPLLVKVCSVSWRFLRYYRHDEAYRARGRRSWRCECSARSCSRPRWRCSSAASRCCWRRPRSAGT